VKSAYTNYFPQALGDCYPLSQRLVGALRHHVEPVVQSGQICLSEFGYLVGWKPYHVLK